MQNNDFDKTMLFDAPLVEDKKVKDVLMDVDKSLQDKGYNSISQIMGYLISNDPAYISSYQDARKKLLSLTREEIIEELLKSYLGKLQ